MEVENSNIKKGTLMTAPPKALCCNVQSGPIRINFYLALRSLRATQRSVLRHIVNPPLRKQPQRCVVLRSTSVDAGASLGASLRKLASEAGAVCVHS